MEILSCGKCVLQHFRPCGNPAHFDAHRIAVKHYMGKDVTEVHWTGLGDPQAKIWARFYEQKGETANEEVALVDRLDRNAVL